MASSTPGGRLPRPSEISVTVCLDCADDGPRQAARPGGAVPARHDDRRRDRHRLRHVRGQPAAGRAGAAGRREAAGVAGRRVRLTPAGRRLAEHGRTILAAVTAAELELSGPGRAARPAAARRAHQRAALRCCRRCPGWPPPTRRCGSTCTRAEPDEAEALLDDDQVDLALVWDYTLVPRVWRHEPHPAGPDPDGARGAARRRGCRTGSGPRPIWRRCGSWTGSGTPATAATTSWASGCARWPAGHPGSGTAPTAWRCSPTSSRPGTGVSVLPAGPAGGGAGSVTVAARPGPDRAADLGPGAGRHRGLAGHRGRDRAPVQPSADGATAAPERAHADCTATV